MEKLNNGKIVVDKIIEIYHPEIDDIVINTERYTRDYWLKLYAGMAMQGMSAIPDMVTPDNKTPTYDELADESYNRAISLVNKMFKDES